MKTRTVECVYEESEGDAIYIIEMENKSSSSNITPVYIDQNHLKRERGYGEMIKTEGCEDMICNKELRKGGRSYQGETRRWMYTRDENNCCLSLVEGMTTDEHPTLVPFSVPPPLNPDPHHAEDNIPAITIPPTTKMEVDTVGTQRTGRIYSKTLAPKEGRRMLP